MPMVALCDLVAHFFLACEPLVLAEYLVLESFSTYGLRVEHSDRLLLFLGTALDDLFANPIDAAQHRWRLGLDAVLGEWPSLVDGEVPLPHAQWVRAVERVRRKGVCRGRHRSSRRDSGSDSEVDEEDDLTQSSDEDGRSSSSWSGSSVGSNILDMYTKRRRL